MKSEAEVSQEKEKVEQPPKVEEEEKLLSEDDKKALTNVEEGSKSSDSAKKQAVAKSTDKNKGEDKFYMDPASIASDKDLHKKVVRVREELEAELLKRLKMQASLFRKIEKSFHLCFFDE